MSRFFTLLLFWSALVCAVSDTEPACANPVSFHDAPAGLLTDTIPPVITCPPSDTFQLATGLCDSVYTYTVTAFDSLLELTPSQLSGLASGEAFPVGTTVNNFLAVDSAGNTAICSFSVVVEPATLELTCRADTATLYLGADCMVALDVATALVAPYACVDDYMLEFDTQAPIGNGPWAPAVFGDAQRGTIQGFRVTDAMTGMGCFGFVKILDTLPPVLECPDINVPCAVPTAHLAPEFLADSLGIAAGMPVLVENCMGSVSFGHVDVNMDVPCDSPGNVTNVITRFWTVLDASNNVGTCVQRINRVRSIDDALFPADTIISCAMDTLPSTTGEPYVQLGAYQYNLLSAPFCEIAATYTDSVEMLCGGSRRLFRKWSVRDGCLPDSMQTPVTGLQMIEIQDDQQPTVHCPADTVVQYMLDGCRDTIDLPDLIVSDACSFVLSVEATWAIDGQPDTLEATLGNISGGSLQLAFFGLAPDFPVGSTLIQYVATDACGNTSSCAMQLIVWDSIPPAVLCDSIQHVYLDVFGHASLGASDVDDGSADACSGEVFFKIKRLEPGACDSLGNPFDDSLNFCCPDLNDSVQVILRVYDVPVPPGPVSDNLGLGQFSDCMLPVVVLDSMPPQCQAPPDTLVLCENFDINQLDFGAPVFSCQVDSYGLEVDIDQFDTYCKQGVVTRTFQVFDAGGQSSQCTQTITISNQQHYFVRFPDDLYVSMCDTTGYYGEPVFFGIDCEKMDVKHTDSVFTAVSDACFKIERTWIIKNNCHYDSSQALVVVPNPEPNSLSVHPDNLPGPVVSEAGTTGMWAPTRLKINASNPDSTDFSIFWSADVNGYQYKQVIKIVDIEQPQFVSCLAATTTFVDSSINDFALWNANYTTVLDNPNQDLCEGNVDLRITITDACFGSNLGVDYVLSLDIDGDDIQETEVSSNDLPTAGSVQFDNINIPGGLPKQFDQRPVVPNEKYQFVLQTVSISGKYRTVRLAWHTAAAPAAYSLPQLPLGNHSIRWTIYDGCGNENECVMNFRVEDPDGTCTPAEVFIGGTIQTEAGDPVANTAIQLEGTHPSLPMFNLFTLTDQQGQFSLSVPTSSSYTITPFRDDSPLNGVSTFDLLLINKHVLGLAALDSPYKLIAADANKSNSVTTFDIVELRKLILGLYLQLPSNGAWRFVPVGYAFPDPNNPFMGGFPEYMTQVNLQQNNLPMHNFIAMKVGDVNGNATTDLTNEVVDDRNGPSLFFDAKDQRLEPGAVVSAHLKASEVISGFQFTLNYPGMELIDLEPGVGLATDNFAVFNRENTLTASWNGEGQPEFTLHFRVLEAGQLRERLQLSNRVARSEAYSEALVMMPVALRFDDTGVTRAGFELYQNRPNPFNGATSIGFYLPEAKTATLRVWDAQGQLLLTQTANYSAGTQTIELDNGQLGASPGLLYYELKTDTERAVRKMVVY
ncbi:MAG: HYR domain-containing protein [Lewinellaceae bacterium]|nr:HYR domain-containing protein [Saprospiraceae bacterium]MCB9333968.1 HYR domain-containing protein [Lewinellaceae bacterium]